MINLPKVFKIALLIISLILLGEISYYLLTSKKSTPTNQPVGSINNPATRNDGSFVSKGLLDSTIDPYLLSLRKSENLEVYLDITETGYVANVKDSSDLITFDLVDTSGKQIGEYKIPKANNKNVETSKDEEGNIICYNYNKTNNIILTKSVNNQVISAKPKDFVTGKKVSANSKLRFPDLTPLSQRFTVID